ncbi:MAG: DUF2332 domain-containing protein [Chakrabartia sp.]
MTDRIRAAFRQQAEMCRAAGSPFTAEILVALAEVMDRETQTGSRVLDWTGDPLADALPLRLAGALHALARTDKNPPLSELYAEQSGDLPRIIARTLVVWDAWLLPWLEGPPQTNEVGRAAALWPGMMRIARRFGPRMEWIELGASGGLNLVMDHYGYRLGGAVAGNLRAELQLVPDWQGADPDVSDVSVLDRVGFDLNPLAIAEPEIAERLLAYIWPDQRDRLTRARTAIAVARPLHPPVIRGDAVQLLGPLLAEPQAEGRTRVIFHSVVLQYFSAEDRMAVRDMIEAAGVRATPARPLAWLSLEFQSSGAPMAELRLRCWPGTGVTETLATVHPHGAEVNWVANPI